MNLGEFLQNLRKLPRAKRVQVMWLAVVVSGALVFWGWAVDLSLMLAQVNQLSIARSQPSQEPAQTAPPSLFASFLDLYQDIKDIFSGTRSEIKIQKQPEALKADQGFKNEASLPLDTQPSKSKEELKVKSIKPGGLPLE